ncbi:MAG: 1-(5-phosphoribosyl)-5-[(5-phosphoribosylamino)methylideneamino]imidazole-4-carboxamide isomerase [Elusimicrobia bacterium]|nr:1-(5-phosphoribosyl)-5-[(5-phosphoribosylamino)methylideneamino]imidazole-4-carboxamide isomerase [Elusimicrobiota bacterium]
MLIIPAIDIRDGNCVMLQQGKIEDETIYSKDPVFMAKLWQMKGARRLHVVDLDGAFSGMPRNLEIIKKIRAAVDIPMEVGGGIRSIKAVETLIDIGVNYIILGTVVVYNPAILRQALDAYGDKIIVALDARDGKVAIGGWKDTTAVDAVELAQKMKAMKVAQILFTDINKDGMMAGPNLSALKTMAEESGVPILASGGVTTLEDIVALKALEPAGISGAIIGKALYTESIKLDEAIKSAQ